MFFVVLAASYRKLWRHIEFWALVLAFILAYCLIISNVAMRGIQLAIICGLVGSASFTVLASIIAVRYHRGPNPPRWLGPVRPLGKIPNRDTLLYVSIALVLVIAVTVYAFHSR